MGWLQDLLTPAGNTINDVQPRPDERFPSHTYGPGYPIVVRREELDDLVRLLERESDAPDSWDNTPLLSREDFEEVIGDTVGDIAEGLPSPEDRREEIRDITALWKEQLSGSADAVWTTIGTDHRFKFYITRCEQRAELEDDDFQELEELDTARNILKRIQSAQNSDAKLAIVHKRDLPLQVPEED